MKKCRILAALLGVALLSSGWVVGQDRQKGGDDKKSTEIKPPIVYRGQLPAGWRKLGLTDDQRQQVYKVQHDYRLKIEALERQIEELKKESRKDMEKVLTDAQKARLKELRDNE